MRITNTEQGKVLLLAGGGRCFTDIAARFCHSERSVDDICDTPYSAAIVKGILSSGHLAATEFDYYVFAIEGYSRVTEVQLVRKRLASYLIKSGRAELNGKRKFSVVLPKNVLEFKYTSSSGREYSTGALLFEQKHLYEAMIDAGIPEEDARYIKPQATEFKAIIGMNAHALIDWFAIRCCQNAQHEIRDLANKMLTECRRVSPDLFSNAGANCVRLGYCPENARQNEVCVKAGRYLPKSKALEILEREGRK
jgi:thymidylate synthase (FAD)